MLRIVLTRSEGPTEECRKPKEFDNFIDSDIQLNRWARTAPDDKSYHKVDFLIQILDEGIVSHEYKGKYHLEAINIHDDDIIINQILRWRLNPFIVNKTNRDPTERAFWMEYIEGIAKYNHQLRSAVAAQHKNS